MRGEETYQLDHVAIGLPRIADAMGFVVGELGGRPFIGGPGVGFRGGQWRFANGALLELIEPAGPPGGFLHRFLAARGPGIHHVTFKVDSLAAAIARCRALGFEVVGISDTQPTWKEAFLHPRQAQGIVVQLAEAHPELGEEWQAHWVPPPSPPPARPAAALVALRLGARERAEALRLWSDCLGGAVSGEGGVLVLRWRNSPLTLSIELDPHAEAGPLGIEFAAARRLALPEGGHPVLGARFVAVEATASAGEA
jgi:methylmalonyl-CoA/ethylmalonyl-CoA epimerase